jgi:ribosomal protein L14
MIDESGAADSQSAYILGALADRALKGATVDELVVLMTAGAFPTIHNGTVAGRMVHLEKQGSVIKTAVVRKTRSNRQANVYMLACYSDKAIVLSSVTLSDLRPALKTMWGHLEDGKAVRIDTGGAFHQLLQQYFGGAE